MSFRNSTSPHCTIPEHRNLESELIDAQLAQNDIRDKYYQQSKELRMLSRKEANLDRKSDLAKAKEEIESLNAQVKALERQLGNETALSETRLEELVNAERNFSASQTSSLTVLDLGLKELNGRILSVVVSILGKEDSLENRTSLTKGIAAWCKEVLESWDPDPNISNRLKEKYQIIREREDKEIAKKWLSITKSHLPIHYHSGELKNFILAIPHFKKWTGKIFEDSLERKLQTIISPLIALKTAIHTSAYDEALVWIVEGGRLLLEMRENGRRVTLL